jgi:hypothetical protein
MNPTIDFAEENLLAKLAVDALPAEEKEKLYQAINYSENTAPIKYPVEVSNIHHTRSRLLDSTID